MTTKFELENHTINFWQEITNDFSQGISKGTSFPNLDSSKIEENFFKKILLNDQTSLPQEKIFISFVNQSRHFYHFAKIISTNERLELAEKLMINSCQDGGYNQAKGSLNPSLYGSWLALITYQCLGIALPEEQKFLKATQLFLTADTACKNQLGEKNCSASATYAMLDILSFFEEDIPTQLIEWLQEMHLDSGGYRSSEIIPIADISTTYYIMRALKKYDNLIVYDSDIAFTNSLQADCLYKNHQYDEASYEATFYAYCIQGLLKK